MNMSEHVQYLNQYILEKTGFGFNVYDQYGKKEIKIHDRNIRLEPFQFLWIKEHK